jgi:hypothetical protein
MQKKFLRTFVLLALLCCTCMIDMRSAQAMDPSEAQYMEDKHSSNTARREIEWRQDGNNDTMPVCASWACCYGTDCCETCNIL